MISGECDDRRTLAGLSKSVVITKEIARIGRVLKPSPRLCVVASGRTMVLRLTSGGGTTKYRQPQARLAARSHSKPPIAEQHAARTQHLPFQVHGGLRFAFAWTWRQDGVAKGQRSRRLTRHLDEHKSCSRIETCCIQIAFSSRHIHEVITPGVSARQVPPYVFYKVIIAVSPKQRTLDQAVENDHKHALYSVAQSPGGQSFRQLREVGGTPT